LVGGRERLSRSIGISAAPHPALPLIPHERNMMDMRWLFALLLLVAPTARAQEAAAPAQPQVQPQPQLQPQPQPSPEPTPDEVLAIGRDAPGRMTVPVKIGAQGPWPFTIDTGAERTVISRELASLLALPPGPRVRLTAMAGTSEVDTVRIPEITSSSVSGTRI